MPTPIPFTDNYQDLSTDQGFQFRFDCERCGNGHLSSFQTNKIGIAGEAMRAAGGLLGGVLGRAADSAFDVQRLVGGPQHDAALRRAVQEISSLFKQCQRCGQWVCSEVCWNDARNQCVHCSPKMDQEIEAIESEATITQLRAKAMNDLDMTGGVQLVSAAAALKCPTCAAEVPAGHKFCGECGADVAAKPRCGACNTEAAPGTKFCGACGARL